MKKLLFYIVLLLNQMAFAQSIDHAEGGFFLKRIEYNVISHGDKVYNLSSKSVVERILFGTTNSFVEFVFNGCSEGIDEVSAFRIIKNDQTDSYQLEITRIPIIEIAKIEDKLSAKSNQIVIPGKLQGFISSEGMDLIREHNKEALRSVYSDDLYKPYRPKSKLFKISNELAEKMHRKTASLIEAFKADGIPSMINDGYVMTFRCVSGNEIWTLTIHEPQNKARRLADIYMQIINTYDNKTDESQYLKLLDE